MLQNPCKTLGFMKNMVYKIPPGGGGKPYPASGLLTSNFQLCKNTWRREWHFYLVCKNFVRSNLTKWEELIVCFNCLYIYCFEKASEYDQEIPQSHIADQPMALRG